MPDRLKFNSQGKFIITQFTDLHYHKGSRSDLKTVQLMRDILAVQKPDLVVLTGDIIDGGFCRDPIKALSAVMQPVLEHKLPWAAVFGNHDDEGRATRLQLMEAMQQLPGCLASPGPEDVSGVGNYILTIIGHHGPAARLFFLDSHAYADKKAKQYAWIKPDQIDWYAKSPHDLPALMFFHIPLPEYDDAWNAGDHTGSKNERVCCPPQNSGMFDALKSAGDVMGVFVGHDHTNDYNAKLAGIQLVYGRAGGFSTYGRRGFAHGARIIQLTEGQKHFDTHVLMAGHLHRH